MADSAHEFVERLVANHPWLQPMVDEHLEGYEELLPYVLMGDIARVAVALQLMGAERKDAVEELRKLLMTLSWAFIHDDGDVANMIGLAFLKNLPRPGEPGAAIADALPPVLAQALEDLRS